MMEVIENGIVVPYAISLQDIEKGRNVDFDQFLYSCQVNADTGQDQIQQRVLMVALNWNCAIKFKGFYLPVVVRVYMHDHFMKFDNKKKDFAELAGVVRNSFYAMKKTWRKEMAGSTIENLLQDANEVIMAQVVNDILEKAEYYGFYD